MLPSSHGAVQPAIRPTDRPRPAWGPETGIGTVDRARRTRRATARCSRPRRSPRPRAAAHPAPRTPDRRPRTAPSARQSTPTGEPVSAPTLRLYFAARRRRASTLEVERRATSRVSRRTAARRVSAAPRARPRGARSRHSGLARSLGSRLSISRYLALRLRLRRGCGYALHGLA